jgi:FtsP/CotA-like multicopper oxidase with cupredoxin domain/cytochrome oxidase Cu insertion factor (SCO1/SenC/PrrC family)
MKTCIVSFYILVAAAAHAFAISNAFQTVITADADPSVRNPASLTEYRSVNGVLALDITATYDSANPNGAVFPLPPPADGSSPAFYRLAYSCKYTGSGKAPVVSYAGPFLRVFPGDHVVINFTNRLSVERTNIHFHGLGITPKIGTSDGLDYGDYVGLPYVNFVNPGDTRQFDFYIPKEQRQGLYWYHSHAHGVAEIQVGTGLSGPLLVEGEIPAHLASWSAKVRNLLPPEAAAPLISQVQKALPNLPVYVLTLKDFSYPGDANGISGPFEQSVNGKVTFTFNNPTASTPFWINSNGTKQIWSIVNTSADLYYNLTFQVNGTSLPFEIISEDGGPDDPAVPSMNAPETSLLLQPGARATVLVPTDALGTHTAKVVAAPINTSLGCTPGYELAAGDRYFQPTSSPYAFGDERATPWVIIEVHPTAQVSNANPMPSLTNFPGAQPNATPSYLRPSQIDAAFVFSQPWFYSTPSPSAPAQLPQENASVLTFYKYVSNANGGPNNVKNPLQPYDSYEPAIATLVPGVPQNWIIQNSTQEWHDFHLHQCHFQVDHFTVVPFPFDPTADPTANTARPQHSYQHEFYSKDLPPPAGKQYGDPLYVGFSDTVSVPPMTQVWIHIPMTEGTHGDDPIAGHMVMHCHILNHEDAGMMANIQAANQNGIVSASRARANSSFSHALPPLEIPSVRTDRPLALADSAGRIHGANVFSKNEYSLVTFGFTHCDGACPATVGKCLSALGGLPVKDQARIASFFVSLDPDRDHGQVLDDYAVSNHLPGTWKVLSDTDLKAMRAFGVRREIRRRADGAMQIWHSATVYIVDRKLNIRAAFDPEDSVQEMDRQLKELLSGNSKEFSRGKSVTIEKSNKSGFSGAIMTAQD